MQTKALEMSIKAGYLAIITKTTSSSIKVIGFHQLVNLVTEVGYQKYYIPLQWTNELAIL